MVLLDSFKIGLAVLIQYRRVTDRHPASQPYSQQRCRSIYRAYYVARITRNSAIADKPARHVYRSVKVTKHSAIPYVRYSFLLCNSNFVFKIFFTIFDFKNVVTLKSGSEVTQGH